MEFCKSLCSVRCQMWDVRFHPHFLLDQPSNINYLTHLRVCDLKVSACHLDLLTIPNFWTNIIYVRWQAIITEWPFGLICCLFGSFVWLLVSFIFFWFACSFLWLYAFFSFFCGPLGSFLALALGTGSFVFSIFCFAIWTISLVSLRHLTMPWCHLQNDTYYVSFIRM